MAMPANDPAPIFLTRDPISARSLADAIRSDASGAIATFEGTVRSERRDDGVELTALEYTSHEPMAMEQMNLLRDRAHRQFEISRVAIAHRIGRLAIGDVSVAIAVAAAHRASAFEACRWIIDTLKVDVPIWKKDVWADGREEWTAPT